MATDTNTFAEDRIGGFRFVRVLHLLTRLLQTGRFTPETDHFEVLPSEEEEEETDRDVRPQADLDGIPEPGLDFGVHDRPFGIPPFR